MKKLLLFPALLLAGAITTHAQDAAVEAHDKAMKDYPPRFGIKAGFNNATLSTSDGSANFSDKRSVFSFNAGVYADVPLLPVLSVQPGIMLSGKGGKYTSAGTASNNSDISTRPVYLEIPVNIIVKVPLPNKVKLFVGAGPYLAFGIAGKSNVEGTTAAGSYSFDKSIDWGGDDNSTTGYSLRRLDFGLSIIGGVEVSHFTLDASYGYGIVNIAPSIGGDDSKFHNRALSVSVGFIL